MTGVTRDLPVLRDTDGYIYVREEVGGLLMGGFEPAAKPWGMDGVPRDFAFSLLPEDWEHFRVLMEQACVRIPALETAPVRRTSRPRRSPPTIATSRRGTGAAELLRLRRCTGRHRSPLAPPALPSIVAAPSMDLWTRHPPLRLRSGNADYLRERTKKSSDSCTDALAVPPAEPRARARPSCTSASAAGRRLRRRRVWTRQLSPRRGKPRTCTRTHGRTVPCAGPAPTVREPRPLHHSRSRSYGSRARRDGGLQLLCANDVDVAPGRIVYTQMLNARGGIECDLTVTRLADDTYLVVTVAAAATHDADWIRRGIDGARVGLTDVTSAFTVLGVMGPRSRDLLSRLTAADLSNAAFPFATAREIELGYATVRATRIPMLASWAGSVRADEFAPGVYEDIVAAARSSACATPAITRWTRCGWRRAIAPGPRHRRRRHAARGGAGLRRRLQEGLVGREALLRSATGRWRGG